MAYGGKCELLRYRPVTGVSSIVTAYYITIVELVGEALQVMIVSN